MSERISMNKWGKGSKHELDTTDFVLRDVADEVLPIKDHSVIKGHRNEKDQHQAFLDGHSKLDWPNGNHNDFPSRAIDVKTYPEPEPVLFLTDPNLMSTNELRLEVKRLREQVKQQPLREEQLYLLGVYKGVGHMMGIPIRTGADWDRDGEIQDNGFDDFFHVELDEGY